MNEKLQEYIQDTIEGGVISDCCGAPVVYDLCTDCKEHCTPIYDEVMCECGGNINAEDNHCMICGKKYEE
jgi:hypothetical protein